MVLPTEKLIQGHENFLEEFKKNKNFFLELAEKGQYPKVFWIGCSDSRVNPELIMGAQPGDIFVVRNIANIIPPKNSGVNCAASALEYAVTVLHVSHVVICGHTDCGGIKAILAQQPSLEDSVINHWLKHAHPAKERALTKQPAEESCSLEIIKENVILQKEHLLTYDHVDELYKSGKLKIHQLLYNLHTGTISAYKEEKNSWSDKLN